MIEGEKGSTVEEGYAKEEEIERERREIKRGNRRENGCEDERADERGEEGVNLLERETKSGLKR